MRWTGKTHPGHVRHRNEDAWGIRSKAGVAAVADGVGGAPGGDRPALIAVDRTLGLLAAAPWPDGGGAERRRVVREAHQAILGDSEGDPALAGMATTLTAVRWRGDRLEGVHVGDSRAYSVGQRGIEPLTVDHTPAGEASRQGKISREELRSHPQKHLLLRGLGGRGPLPEPELFELQPFPPNVGIFLCTDGVEAALPESEVAPLLFTVFHGRTPQEVLDDLFDAALSGAAPDNLTAVLLLPGD